MTALDLFAYACAVAAVTGLLIGFVLGCSLMAIASRYETRISLVPRLDAPPEAARPAVNLRPTRRHV